MDIGNIANCILTDLDKGCTDYEIDGITYCGKCGMPKKKVRRNSKGDEIVIPLRCKCTSSVYIPNELTAEEWEERRSAQQEQKKKDAERARLLRLDENTRKAFDDVRLRQWTFENDDEANAHISSVARKYADNFYAMLDRGKGLLLYGGVGTGKSYMAACIVNEILNQGFRCRFTNFSRLANTLLGSEFREKQDYLDSLKRYDLLVIDDLGSERSTAFMNEVVYSVIDARQVSQLPLIVTTNLTGDELKHPADIHSERVFSRLFEMCIPVEVKGKDRRKLKLRDSDKDLKEMLGLL